MKRNLIIAALLIAASSSVSLAIVLVVHDPGMAALTSAKHAQSEATKAVQAARAITEVINQIRAIQALTKDFKDYRSYLTIINGKWAQKIPGMEKLGSMMNDNSPGDLRNLGWDLELFERARHLRTKGQALNELRRVLDSQARARDFAQMHESIEAVYGEVPVTAEGVAIEAAYREIATVSARVGESQKAIEQKRERIVSLREQIESGELAPGDIERTQAQIAAEQVDLSILQTDAINNATRASVSSLGLAAGEKSERVRGAIADREIRLEMSQRLTFGLATARDERVE